MRLTIALRAALTALVLSLILPAAQALAGPATDVVQNLNGNILRIMQNAKTLGYKGRYKEFEPILTRTFDMPFMAERSIGRKWAELSTPQKNQVIDTFRRYTTALYASRFDSYSSQKFEILGERQNPAEKDATVVINQFIDSKGKAVGINYVVRAVGNRWMAFDVYLNGSISEVAVRRSEFATTVNSQGVDALIKQIEARIAVVEEESIKKGG